MLVYTTQAKEPKATLVEYFKNGVKHYFSQLKGYKQRPQQYEEELKIPDLYS